MSHNKVDFSHLKLWIAVARHSFKWLEMEMHTSEVKGLSSQNGLVTRKACQGAIIPANTRHWAIVGSMLFHRLRRWPNIEPTLAWCLVFAGIITTFYRSNANSSNCSLETWAVTAVCLNMALLAVNVRYGILYWLSEHFCTTFYITCIS